MGWRWAWAMISRRMRAAASCVSVTASGSSCADLRLLEFWQPHVNFVGCFKPVSCRVKRLIDNNEGGHHDGAGLGFDDADRHAGGIGGHHVPHSGAASST